MNSVEIDRSMPKIIILASAAIISLFFFSYFLKLFFIGGGLLFILLSAILAVVFLIAFILQNLFIKSFKIVSLIGFLESLALVGIFYDQFDWMFILFSVVSFFLLFLLTSRNGSRELDNMLKIDFWRFSNVILPKALSIIFLFVSAIYIYSGISKEGFLISQVDFNRILFSSEMIVQKFMPEFSFSLSLNELASNFAEQQIKENPLYAALPAAAKNKLISQASNEFMVKISDFFGGVLNVKLKISEAVYEALKNKFILLSSQGQAAILTGAIFSIFMLLGGVALPIRLLIAFLAFLIYESLLALDFASIELEGRSREIIVLK